ncbi:MAG: Gfo/Idh/MocA family oxidoreductase [Caldilineaceae bacterium]|nr:Gfo/Idh/MocA family oxidoreductase [Caldilineaceae bacterium]
MLRIALLSFAHVHADGYARHVANHPEAEIVCVWDDDVARGQAAAQKFQVPYVSDLNEVLRRTDVDAVVVNAETAKHKEVLLAAVRHGKHIFTEKALTITTADAEEVVQAVNASGIQFMISLPSRTRPETLFLKQVLDNGWLGRITMMRARVAHSAALGRWFKGGSLWFGDAALAGGGALFDLGCHTTDIMRWFLGEPASVIAKVQNFSQAYDIDDQTLAVVEFKNGALGILDTSWVHRAGPNPVEIYGTDGYVGYNGRPGDPIQLISTQLQPGDIQGAITPSRLPDPLPLPMDQWIAAILHGAPTTITVEDGRNLTQLLEGVYRAAQTKAEVRLG